MLWWLNSWRTWLLFLLTWLTWFSLLFQFRSKLNNYDDVVERLAGHLNLDDPSKIRLTSHNCYSQQPKPQPIKYRGVEHLSDMLAHYNQVAFSLFWPLNFLIDKLTETYIFVVVADFRHFVLWSIGYPSARITRSENSESCLSSCYKRWSKCWVTWHPSLFRNFSLFWFVYL